MCTKRHRRGPQNDRQHILVTMLYYFIIIINIIEVRGPHSYVRFCSLASEAQAAKALQLAYKAQAAKAFELAYNV